jgi:peptide/nickel transport system substrate-binding protein
VNRQSRALLTVLILGVVVFVGWRACSPASDNTSGGEIVISEVGTRGGTLVSSARSEPRTFNRVVDQSFAVDLFSILTSGKLIRMNRATRAIEPALAERWTSSPDNRTYTLTLREGVAWSDGAPFTSDDVLFTFEAIYHPDVASVLASPVRINGQPLKVSAPDARTVVITLPDAFGPGIAILDNVYVQPKHKLQAALAGGTFGQALGVATPPADLAFIGPFVLKSYEPGQRMVFDRNPRYWKKDAAGIQLPYLDQVVLEVVPDQNAELLRLQSGQIDMLQQQVRPEDVATLRPLVDQGRLRVIELGVGVDPDVMFFNLRGPYWDKDPRREWITRKEFRKAI